MKSQLAFIQMARSARNIWVKPDRVKSKTVTSTISPSWKLPGIEG